MRVYGRINQTNGIGGTWVVVETDASGYSDQAMLTALAQALKLNLGESPFWANSGIPAQQTIVTQVYPDYYAALTQQQFAPYFAALVIQRVQGSFPPVYTVNVTCHNGAQLSLEVAT